MKYADGEDVQIWDRFRAPASWRGIVVFSIDRSEYSPQFPKDHWAYLARGVMVDTSDAGLVHHPDELAELLLDRRGDRPLPEEWADLRQLQLTSSPSDWKSGSGASVQIGAVNPHGQTCLGHRGVAGTAHLHLAYRTECGWCGQVYGVNGSDMHARPCPACQGGAAGILY